MTDKTSPLTVSDTRNVLEWANSLSTAPESSKLASRLLLFTLLFEEMKVPAAKALLEFSLIDQFVRMLESSVNCLCSSPHSETPKWMAPLLLLLDLYQKTAMASQRNAALQELVVS